MFYVVSGICFKHFGINLMLNIGKVLKSLIAESVLLSLYLIGEITHNCWNLQRHFLNQSRFHHSYHHSFCVYRARHICYFLQVYHPNLVELFLQIEELLLPSSKSESSSAATKVQTNNTNTYAKKFHFLALILN